MFFLCNLQAGPIAATIVLLLVSGSPVVLNYMPMIRNDGTSVFFATLALLAIFTNKLSVSRRRHFLIGVSIGAAISTKYYLGYVGFPYLGLLLAIWYHGCASKLDVINLLSCMIFGIVTGIFFTAPFIFLDYANAWHWLTFQVDWTSPKLEVLSFENQFIFFVQKLWSIHGYFGAAFAAIGLAAFVRSRNFVAIFSAIGALIAMAVFSTANTYYERWVLAILPVTCLFIANGLAELWRLFGHQKRPIEVR